jgi:putative ABC transport system ATP-binding protein
MPLITLNKVGKTYRAGDESVDALKDVSLEIEKGEFVVIVGPSGSGKSTLLHLIGGLDTPSRGKVVVDGIDLSDMNDRKLSRYRNREIGFIFQEFHLHKGYDLVENVEIPLVFSAGKIRRETTMKKKSEEILSSVGLKGRFRHHPSEISGGQKQRVAIARALINNPKIILADEPTGNLDSQTGKKIIALLKRLHKEKDVTMLVVTHDREIARHAERTIEIKDGRIIEKNHFDKFTD